MLTGCLIKQTVFPFSRRDVNLFPADHIMKTVCIHPGRINNVPCLEISLICMKFISAVNLDNVLHFCS